jgi:pimeloyl-ACP methyl ester carboxylesterase
MRVPVDWSAPQGDQITVAVARRTADNPLRRLGTLFFNPGGPGDPASRYVVAAEQVFSATLRERFDLVAMDPRGVGDSSQIRCGVPVFTPELKLFPRTEQEFDYLREHSRAVGLSCLQQTGDLVRHADTVAVARDHEALRIALGEGQVTWLGVSYGTQIAANYAHLFPGRTRAMVLDAALEHSVPEVHQVSEEILSAEDSFNRFASWCTTAPSCALRGQDVATVFDRLVAAADSRPIPVPGALRAVTGEDIRLGAVGMLRVKEPSSFFGPDLNWAGLSRALRQAIDGDASAFALPGGDVPQLGAFSRAGNACLDYVPQVHSYAEMRQRIELGRFLAPHLQGASETWAVNLCIGWPVRATNPPRALDVHGVPALMVHATHDASDPYEWAHGLAAQIHGIALLTRDGDGHTSYHTSPCAQAATDRFLIQPRAPAVQVCTD